MPFFIFHENQEHFWNFRKVKFDEFLNPLAWDDSDKANHVFGNFHKMKKTLMMKRFLSKKSLFFHVFSCQLSKMNIKQIVSYVMTGEKPCHIFQ